MRISSWHMSAGIMLWLAVVLASTLLVQGCNGDEPPAVDTSTPTPGGAVAQEPAALPERASLQLYSPDSPLNQVVPTDAALDPNSDGYVALIVQAVQDGDFVIELKQYSSPVYFADSSTPRTDVWLACASPWGMGEEYIRDVPVPAFAEPANDKGGASNPIREGECGEYAGQDNQMVVLDTDARMEYDFWQARRENGRWVASWANSISMDSTGIYPNGMSARGSGFSTLSGLIWPDELNKGRIDHALVLSYPYPKAGGPVPPATESDGTSDHEYALPEGARVRLDPALDLEGLDLTPAEKTIARALQEYGMFLVDSGGSVGVSIEAVDPRSVRGNPYQGLLPDVDLPQLENIPVDRFQVLELPPQMSE